jgi:phage terminase large subunit-like protein
LTLNLKRTWKIGLLIKMKTLITKQINKAAFFSSVGYRPHSAQWLVHNSKARFRTVVAGRRFGKSLLASHEAMTHLIVPDQRIWIVAPTYELTKKVFRQVYWSFHRYIPRWIKKSSDADLKIELVNGSVLECKSADNPVSLIGEGIHFLIVDECARIPEIVWNQALRPGLTDTEGNVLLISTPAGMNWFQQMYVRGQDSKERNYESWQFPSSKNPYLKAEEIAEAKRTLPERVFMQEYMAEFMSDAGSVFRRIDSCIKGNFEEPVEGERYVAGVDLAKYSDFTVIIVGKVIDGEHLHIVAFDRFNQLDWSLQKRKIIALARKYNNASIVIDSTGAGDSVFEELSKEYGNIQPFRIISNTVKNQLIENLVVGLESGLISFPAIQELINELKIFGFERSEKSGRTLYSAPSGFHDDCVIALALLYNNVLLYPPLIVRGSSREAHSRQRNEANDKAPVLFKDTTGHVRMEPKQMTWGEKLEWLRKMR